MTGAKQPTACLLIIGNEVLSGRTKDANLAYLGMELSGIGVRMAEARVVADEEDLIAAAVNECRAKYDYVFTTGGIGPTHDDITAASVAKAFGKKLVRHPDAVAMFEKKYSAEDLNEARLKMTEVADGATLIENPVSGAPGFKIENVYVMAGIPRVMQGMFQTFKDTLARGEAMLSRTINSHAREGDLGTRLGEIQKRFGDVEIGSYPYFREGGRTGVKVQLRAADAARLDAAEAEVVRLIRELGHEPIPDNGETEA